VQQRGSFDNVEDGIMTGEDVTDAVDRHGQGGLPCDSVGEELVDDGGERLPPGRTWARSPV
jgi:hypothetical protein